MAQVLKNSQREKILNSALSEFAKYGIQKTSIRNIAKKSGMTVGNIYHYYKNKQDIANAVLAPALDKLNCTLKEMLSKNMPILNSEHHMLITEDEMKNLLITLANIIADIEENHTEELYVIINDEEINNIYSTIFLGYIEDIFNITKPFSSYSQPMLDMLAKSFTTAIFSGVKECVIFKYNNPISKEDFREILTIFLSQSFLILKF